MSNEVPENRRVCRDGNLDQWTAFNVMVQMAQLEDDPYEIKDGVIWVGGMVKRCFPDRFPDYKE